MASELKIERERPPDDADPDSPTYGCGWEYNHDARIITDDEDGVYWACRNCDADGWLPPKGGAR